MVHEWKKSLFQCLHPPSLMVLCQNPFYRVDDKRVLYGLTCSYRLRLGMKTGPAICLHVRHPFLLRGEKAFQQNPFLSFPMNTQVLSVVRNFKQMLTVLGWSKGGLGIGDAVDLNIAARCRPASWRLLCWAVKKKSGCSNLMTDVSEQPHGKVSCLSACLEYPTPTTFLWTLQCTKLLLICCVCLTDFHAGFPKFPLELLVSFFWWKTLKCGAQILAPSSILTPWRTIFSLEVSICSLVSFEFLCSSGVCPES